MRILSNKDEDTVKRCTVLRPKRNVAGNVNTQVQCVLNNFECHDQEPYGKAT